jgi:hypothetical protein
MQSQSLTLKLLLVIGVALYGWLGFILARGVGGL